MSSGFNSMEDLIFSRSFRNWVLNRESTEKAFWENWIGRNPDKAEMVKYARAVIYALHLHTPVLSEDEIDEEVRKALIRLKEAPRYIPLEGQVGREQRWKGLLRSPFLLVVLLVAAIGSGSFFYYRAHSHRNALQRFLSAHSRESVDEQTTDAVDDHTFNLPDESLVRLGKNSKLYFSREWVPDRSPREVFLEGEAFFDIRKRAATPLYVYAGQLIIRVLGTSFIVHSFPGDARTIVTDVTGEVSVYRQNDLFAGAAGGNAPPGVILTPNQEVVYDRGEDRLHKTVAEKPVPLEGKQDSLLIYQRTPLRQVFGQLQEMYGIPIRFDREALDSCLLTATMANRSFYEKLDLICKDIGGAYEVIDGNILVTAMGCK